MSETHILLSLGGIGLLALASQWLAWRLRLPAILRWRVSMHYGLCLPARGGRTSFATTPSMASEAGHASRG